MSGAFRSKDGGRSGGLPRNLGLLGNGHLLRLSSADLDLARLRRLGNLTRQVDMQHAVGEAGADDLDMVGKAEAPFESAPRDAAVQVIAPLMVLFRLAGHQQSALLDGDVQLT